MDSEAVQDYIEHAQSVIDTSPQMDEANTKAAILQNFLDLLNWEIPRNTQLEYSVEAFGQTYKVDYALILEGTPVAFIEAKGVDTTLTSDHRDQLSSYMRNKDVSYGILTNGKEYRFFQRQVNDSSVSVQEVADVTLQDLSNRAKILRAYTQEAIQTDESGDILNQINELKRARETLEAEKDELATELTTVLTDSVSDALSSLAESQSKAMIDSLIGEIDEEISPSTKEITSPTSISKDTDDQYIVQLLNDDRTLIRISDDTQSEAMADTVDYLIENHDLISEIEPLPYIPGRSKVIINDQTAYPESENEMRLPYSVGEGLFVETHDNKEGKKREISRLAQKCGLELTFDGEW